MFIIILLTIVFIAVRGIHATYLFQIKEYRFDRLQLWISEVGILKSLYFSRIRLPALSLRNGMIVLFLLVVDGLLLLLAIEEHLFYLLLTFCIIVSPLIALVIVAIAVALTDIPVQLYRSILIMRAQFKIRSTNTIFIGVTGSYGKTSVKEYVSHILGSAYKVAKTPQNMNTNIGIALSILRNLKKSTQYFVTEVGAYRAGEIKDATWYIPFTYVILTGLGNQHVGLYGSREILIKEESSLLYQIQDGGVAYVNSAVPDKKTIRSGLNVRTVEYGFHKADITAHILDRIGNHTRARIYYQGNEFTIKTSLLGAHSVENLLPAIAIAIDIGLKPKQIIEAIATIKPIIGKLSLHHGAAKSLILNDAVNSNVDGFLAALEVLQQFPSKTKYVVSQGIIELGAEKRDSYNRILKKIHDTHAKLLTTDPLFATLGKENQATTFNDVSDLQKKLLSIMNKHTVILLEGKFTKDFVTSIMQ